MTWALPEINEHLHCYFPWRLLPRAPIKSPSLAHCALLIYRELLDTAMVRIIALLVVMSLRWRPCSHALNAQWPSDSAMWNCYQISPASYGAFASLGISKRLELAWAWGQLHMKAQGPYPEWKSNPLLLSQPPSPTVCFTGQGLDLL